MERNKLNMDAAHKQAHRHMLTFALPSAYGEKIPILHIHLARIELATFSVLG